MVLGRQRVAGQHGNTQPGGDHIAHRLQRIGARRRGVVAIELRTGIEHLVAEAMTDGKQDRMLGGELGGLDGFAPRPPMLLRHHHLERLFVQEVGHHPGRLKRQRNDRRVDAPAAQCRFEMLGEVFLDLQRHLRRERVERWNQVGQQVGSHGVDDTEPEHADQLVPPGLGDIANPRRLLEHLLGLFDDALAHRRDADFGLAALEELRPELILEFLDRNRQRRLAHEAALRGAAEAPFLRDGDQVAQLVERHRPLPARKRANPAAVSGCLSP